MSSLVSERWTPARELLWAPAPDFPAEIPPRIAEELRRGDPIGKPALQALLVPRGCSRRGMESRRGIMRLSLAFPGPAFCSTAGPTTLTMPQ